MNFVNNSSVPRLRVFRGTGFRTNPSCIKSRIWNLHLCGRLKLFLVPGTAGEVEEEPVVNLDVSRQKQRTRWPGVGCLEGVAGLA